MNNTKRIYNGIPIQEPSARSQRSSTGTTMSSHDHLGCYMGKPNRYLQKIKKQWKSSETSHNLVIKVLEHNNTTLKINNTEFRLPITPNVLLIVVLIALPIYNFNGITRRAEDNRDGSAGEWEISSTYECHISYSVSMVMDTLRLVWPSEFSAAKVKIVPDTRGLRS